MKPKKRVHFSPETYKVEFGKPFLRTGYTKAFRISSTSRPSTSARNYRVESRPQTPKLPQLKPLTFVNRQAMKEIQTLQAERSLVRALRDIVARHKSESFDSSDSSSKSPKFRRHDNEIENASSK